MIFSRFSICLMLLMVVGCYRATPSENTFNGDDPQRVVSTAPSVTETLVALGVGERLVGVTRFCVVPRELQPPPTLVGDLLNPKREAIIALQPDLIVALTENDRIATLASRCKIPLLTVDHQTLDGILASFGQLAVPFGDGAMARASELRQMLESRLADITARHANSPTVRVLICVDRLRGTGRLQGLFVVGRSPVFSDILRIAGGENVINSPVAFPTISREILLQLDPDVIIDLVTGEETSRAYLDDWSRDGSMLTAVRTNHVYALTEDYATIPGPRIADLIERIAEILDGVRPFDASPL